MCVYIYLYTYNQLLLHYINLFEVLSFHDNRLAVSRQDVRPRTIVRRYCYPNLLTCMHLLLFLKFKSQYRRIVRYSACNPLTSYHGERKVSKGLATR